MIFVFSEYEHYFFNFLYCVINTIVNYLFLPISVFHIQRATLARRESQQSRAQWVIRALRLHQATAARHHVRIPYAFTPPHILRESLEAVSSALLVACSLVASHKFSHSCSRSSVDWILIFAQPSRIGMVLAVTHSVMCNFGYK